MTDPFARIAGICLDIGIIVLVFVSLFWDAPASKRMKPLRPRLKHEMLPRPIWFDILNRAGSPFTRARRT
jgi:hypothetical protein